jgi:hypothetical protein
LKHARDVEQWSATSATGAGTLAPHEAQPSAPIRLIAERFPFQYPEPRMRNALKMRLFPFLATAIGVFRYQL